MIEMSRYTRTAIALHWLVAVLVFAGWSLGIYMHDLPASPAKLQYYSWHKWLGVTVFGLALARAAWRIAHPAPQLPESVAAWQRSAARISHFMLYALLLALPLTGWLMSSAKGFQTVYFGVLPLPDLLAKSEPLGKLLAEVHELLAYTLAALVAVHVAAALKHALVDRDGVLRRMVPVLGAIALTLLLGASAAQQRVDAGKSRITATFRQMKVPVEGEFTAFRGGVAFAPEAPGASAARLEVDTGSFTLGEPDYDEEARGKEWLDAKAHPRATFVADEVAALGQDRYAAKGTFTLKGKSIPLEVRFGAKAAADGRVYEGEFPLSRKAFGIGSASWDDTLDDKVVVKFRITTRNR